MCAHMCVCVRGRWASNVVLAEVPEHVSVSVPAKQPFCRLQERWRKNKRKREEEEEEEGGGPIANQWSSSVHNNLCAHGDRLFRWHHAS